MSSNNDPSSERTPLLGNDGAAETNGDAPHAKQTTLHNIQSWTTRHAGSLIFGTLAVFFAALALVSFITRIPNDGSQSPAVPTPDGDKICTAAGCVLASSTLLRSISPRFVMSCHVSLLVHVC